MVGKSQTRRRLLAELPGHRGSGAGDDPCSSLPVAGRDGGQGSGCRVFAPAGAWDDRCLAGSLVPNAQWRRIHRPEPDRATFHGHAHRRVPALGRRPVLPPMASRRGRAVGPRNGRDMEASFVEWISRGIESVPRGAARVLAGVIAVSPRRGPSSSLRPPPVTPVTGVRASIRAWPSPGARSRRTRAPSSVPVGPPRAVLVRRPAGSSRSCPTGCPAGARS